MRLARHQELDRSIQVKLDRAMGHLDNLRESIDAWREEDHYGLSRHSEREGRNRWVMRWNAVQTEPFPPEWTVIAGEVIYQCHSILDHLAWELAHTKSLPQEPDRVTFPIFASRKNFWKRDRAGCWRESSGGWCLKRIPGPARPIILELQPYKRGNDAPTHPLWHLFTLSNQDKHKSLHVASSALKQQRYKALDLQDLEHLGSGIENDKPFDERASNVFWSRFRETGPKPQVKGQADFEFEPVFGYGSPNCVIGRSFFETLKAIYNYIVREVFQGRFNPLFA